MMFQVIDANLARCSEGLRVIEDLARFEWSDATLTQQCKALRTELKNITKRHFNRVQLINARSTHTDTRANDTIVPRTTQQDVLTANFKRCTEACRVLEEITSIQDFSSLRYNIYNLEQTFMASLHRIPLNGPGIYVIGDNPDHLIECSKKDYVPIIQYRNKTASKSDIHTTCNNIAKEIQANNTLFIVNDFVDIAIACHADGVHIGQDDIPIKHIRNILGQSMIIGKTTHNLEQGIDAEKTGADYVSIGPIWDTPSKPNRPGIGIKYLKKASQLNIPFVAIGGINTKNVHEILEYSPPLIGAIRATKNIENIWNKIN
jgi:thiamine-phosphate pyrophosphorylase